jgi:hypothetical protein
VVGLSDATLVRLVAARYSSREWSAILSVAVDESSPPVVGRYEVIDNALRFTPIFPFDRGRGHLVRFDRARIDGETADHEPPLTAVEGPFLPLDYEFWNADRTRFTVFFDPGRVKKGILPNTQMGRALEVGKSYTLDPAQWRIEAPTAGGQAPLVVTFPEPVDQGLLFRALGVRRGGAVVDGDVTVGVGETQWSFTPYQPWQAGDYNLLALSILEDRAGNQIGRAFEVDNFETVDKGPDPRTVTLPFRVQ